MTKKIALFALVAVGIFSGCSQSSDLVNDLPTPTKEQKVEEKTSISFDTYNAKSAVVRSSRAGYSGDMTTAMLQKEGFGVIAYYTASTDFSSWSIEAPNFMYNTKVYVPEADGTNPSSNAWTYAPTVYWPNGNATADNAGATGAGGGKLSFFAYAPYTAVTPNTGVATGDATTGIKGLSSNAATTAPSVSYSLAGGVDLLWGTAGTNGVTVNNAAQAGTPLTNGNAPVNVDLTKMKTNGKVNFLFKHALARVGSIKVVADVDAVTGGSLSNDSRIYVGVVSIENGMTTGETPVSTLIGDGSLDLTTGLWTAGSTRISLSKSIASSAIPVSGAAAMNTAIEVPNTNPEAVGTKTWEQIFTTAGVTTAATSIYSSSVDPILLIPGAGQHLKVSISYWVTSKDSNLSRGYTWVPQTVTKTISLGTLDLNKSYELVLHLGLNSVKFTATVSDWDNAESSQRVDLPVNVVSE
jgi:hypothetical protein